MCAIDSTGQPEDVGNRLVRVGLRGWTEMFARVFVIVAVGLSTSVVPAAVAVADGQGGGRGVIVAERFSAANGGNPQIVAVDPARGGVRVLTSGNQDLVPDISADGRSVVFERCVQALDCGEIGKVNIWIMRSDGSHAHPLTACDGTKCLGSFDPAFSPDGRSVAFTQDRLDGHGVNFNGVFIMRTDGTHLRRITSTGPDALPDGQPHFSPDGRRLVFQREEPTRTQLMIVRIDGSGLRRLLPGVDGFAPSWAPSGERIAFTLAHHAAQPTSDIATVRPDGTGLRLLTHTTADTSAFTPAYSPPGSRLVWSQSTATGCRLVVATATGRNPRPLPTGDGCILDPSWGRSGPHSD